MSPHLEEIVNRIDAGTLHPRSHSVVRRLAEHLRKISPLCDEVVKAFDDATSVGCTDMQNRLWKEIEGLPLNEQGGRRALTSLLQPDEAIDGYYADYLLVWADQESVPEEAVLSAFAAC